MGGLPRGVKNRAVRQRCHTGIQRRGIPRRMRRERAVADASNFEYVIVDNHSTDDTDINRGAVCRHGRTGAGDATRATPLADRQLQFHGGFASPRTPCYFKTVHADDALLPDCLERMVAIGERHPNVGVIGSRRYVGDGRVDLIGIPPNAEFVPGRWLIRAQLLGAPYTTGAPTSTMIRSSVIRDRVPLYDPSYEHNDDALMYCLLRDIGLRVRRRAAHANTRARGLANVVGVPRRHLDARPSPDGARLRHRHLVTGRTRRRGRQVGDQVRANAAEVDGQSEARARPGGLPVPP